MLRSSSVLAGLLLFAHQLALGQEKATLAVDAKFEGGAAQVVDIDQLKRMIAFRPPVPANGGWQTWWYFKVDGITPGETIKLKVAGGQAPSDRPAFSVDGKTWKFMDAKDAQKIDAKQAWFAWYAPYVTAQAEAVCDWAEKQSPAAKKFELCRSEENRPVWAVKVTEPGDSSKRPIIWIHARQHAWEVGSSWTADGIIRWLVSDDPAAQSLRQRAIVYVVPIMDVDNVFKGLGGKEQRPHDHNRDWSAKPVWKSVQASQDLLQPLIDDRRLKVFLDLHNPGYDAGRDLEFWCTGYKAFVPERKQKSDAFLKIVRGELGGPIVFRGVINESTPANAFTSGRWALAKTQADVVAGCFEIPVAAPKTFQGQPPDHQLILGRELGRALNLYLAGP